MNQSVEARLKAPLLEATRLRRIRVDEFSWIWVALSLLVLVSAFVAPGTLKLGSIAAILPFAAILSLVAVSQTLVIQQRGLDLSGAATVALGGILIARLTPLVGSPFLAAAITIGGCTVIGVVNGVLVARIGLSPIVATLATGAGLSGANRLISSGGALHIPISLQNISHSSVLGVPVTVLIAFALIAGLAVVIKRTVIGRRFIAVGVNRSTALASGTLALRYEIGTYAVAAAICSLAGILLAAFIGYSSTTAGDDYLLAGIAVVVVGGTPFTGGKGSIVASGAAALFMSQLGQMVQALGAGPAQQLLVEAAAIILAVSIRRVPFNLISAIIKPSQGRARNAL